ncbi:MAG: phosphopantetheine-binding protein [Balneolaceae bacterium]
MKQQILFKIEQVICTTLLIENVSPREDLFEAGYLDSLGIVSLIVALEEEFQISLSMENLDLEEFRSVESIHKLILPLITITA